MQTPGIPQTATAREYLRVSFDRSGRERSPQEQHADNEGVAHARGWTLGHPYKDIGSASRYGRKDRADFARLTDDLRSGAFNADILILWESSRGSRKVSEWANLIDLCEARGVSIFVTADGKLYDCRDARDRRTLLEDAVDSAYESDKNSKRAKRARAADAAAGRPNGPTPFGYLRRYDPTTGKFVAQEPNPDEAPVIVELFDRLDSGHSLRGIAKDFEARGIRHRQRYHKETKEPLPRKPFSAQHLRVLATTRAYVGEREHAPGRKDRRLVGTQPIYVKATWEPLVTRVKFFAVQRVLSAPERMKTRPGRGKYLLSMIARCGVCSGPLAVRRQKDEMFYACLDQGHVLVAYDELNTVGEKVMLAYLAHKDNVQRLTADGGGERLAAARDELAEIRTELDDLGDQVGRGEVSATLAARAEPGILVRLRAAEEREQELSTPSVLRGLITPGADVARRWKAAPMSAKREIARILLSPNVLGEMRVTRSPVRNHRTPVEDRLAWRRS